MGGIINQRAVWGFFVSVSLLCGGAIGCEEGGVPTGERGEPPAAPSEDTFYFGVLPAVDELTALDNYRSMMQVLSGELPKPVELKVATDYDALVNSLRNGTVHFAQLSPYVYVSSNISGNVIAQQRMEAEDEYCGVVVVKKNAPYQSLQDLAGKRFAYVGRSSSAGYFYPRMLLRQEGLNPNKHFGQVVYAGSHQDVARKVSGGSVEAGAMSWRTLPEALNLRVLARTETIPDDVIVAASGVADELVQTVKKVLLNPSDHRVLKSFMAERGIAAYVAPEPAIYAPLRKELGLARGETRK